jgi:hypothetical protein
MSAVECQDFYGRCLDVNQTNQVCRDADGLCRSHGERWDYINCLTLECRGHRIFIVTRSKSEDVYYCFTDFTV